MARKHSAKTDPDALSRRVFERLRDDILSGRLRPGEDLSRRQLAQRYKVSYTPVLEAMIRLEQTGLIETRKSQMARVRPLSLDAIDSEYVLREAIEVQTIRLATRTASDEELNDLEKRAAALDARIGRSHAGQAVELAKFEWDFHQRIAELTRYEILVRELERIALLDHFRIHCVPGPPSVPAPTEAHRELVAVMRSRDVAAAERAMRGHIDIGLQNARQVFLRNTMKR